MSKVTFHNLGNADCIRIDLANGKKVLFDYADRRDAEDAGDKRCDLPAELRKDLGDRDSFDVVAFSHLDNDHYDGATEFFYFEHIATYQDDVDGEQRIKMRELWVPAAVITEPLSHDADVEAKAIQKEARARFKAKEGIRVFSRPARLQEWCEEQGIDFEERRDLVTDAGQFVPGFTTDAEGVEFFVHSPFAVRQDENTVVDRNEHALIIHATFTVNETTTKLFLAADATHDVLTDIVTVTESKGNNERLAWDLFKLPHHCSHHALSSKPRQGDKSEPEPKVARLLEQYGNTGALVVSTSDPIPAKGSKQDAKGANPPHRQAANYYRQDVVDDANDFKVTMEHPDTEKPSPLVVEIDEFGTTVKKVRPGAALVAATSRAPRAG